MKTTHTHKLKKHKYKTGVAVYFCTLPDCHFKIDVALSLGKRTICNICNEEFIINEYTTRLTRPHCTGCGKVKVKGEDGKDHYISKISNRQITAGIAIDRAQSLKDRLGSVVSLASSSIEDDI